MKAHVARVSAHGIKFTLHTRRSNVPLRSKQMIILVFRPKG